MNWRGFELHPETPSGGIELSRLHAGQKQTDMGDYIQRFATRFGIHDMVNPDKMPNTRRALAMAEFARDRGKLNEFRSLVMDGRWRDGKDIGDETVLQDLAAAAGLDPQQALAAVVNTVYLSRVDTTRAEYKQIGVGGIPTFVFSSETVEGCRPYEVLATAAHRAGALPK